MAGKNFHRIADAWRGLLGVAALLLSGCAIGKNVPIPTTKHVEYAANSGQQTTLATLDIGRKLFINRCSDCHSLKKPASLAPWDWPEMVDRMTENAKLSEEQNHAIMQYLVAVSTAARDHNIGGLDTTLAHAGAAESTTDAVKSGASTPPKSDDSASRGDPASP